MKSLYVFLTIFFLYGSTALSAAASEHFDLDYAGTNNPKQKLDLIVPQIDRDKPWPLLIYIHGGGWKKGDKRPSLRKVLPFAQAGEYAVASIGYRLSGEAQWPSQIHDCKAAIRYLKAHAKQYHLDPERFAIWGSSAGGHLVAVLGTSSNEKSLEGQIGQHLNQSTKVKCVVDYYGPTNFLTMNQTAIDKKLDHDAPTSPESQLMGAPIQSIPEKVATANPITYIDSKDSPFLIVHGTHDPLVSYNQSERLHAALKKADVPSTFITVDKGGHGKGFGLDVHKKVKLFLAHHLNNETNTLIDQTLPASMQRFKRR